jgi:hypothetical protein
MDDEGTPTEALAAIAGLLADRGEPIGAALFGLMAAATRQHALDREAEAAEAARAKQRQEAQTLIRVACEMDGHALVMDGGPSDLSAREWVAAQSGGK